jgi:hypothetical protein
MSVHRVWHAASACCGMIDEALTAASTVCRPSVAMHALVGWRVLMHLAVPVGFRHVWLEHSSDLASLQGLLFTCSYVQARATAALFASLSSP